jgi:hypothetical protein
MLFKEYERNPIQSGKHSVLKSAPAKTQSRLILKNIDGGRGW